MTRAVLVVALLAATACSRAASIHDTDTGGDRSATTARAPARDQPDDFVDRDRHGVVLPKLYVIVGPRGATATERTPSVSAPGTPPTTASTTRTTGTSSPPSSPGSLLPGFGFAVVGQRTVNGRRYYQLSDERWVAASEFTLARPSDFRGILLPNGGAAPQTPQLALDVAWAVNPDTAVRDAPTPSAAVRARLRRLTRVRLAAACSGGWCRTGDGWLAADDLAVPTLQPPPGEVAPTDPWLDVDLASQTLVAYDGRRPVFATLVSTGIGTPGSPLTTPAGVFTLIDKRELVRMDNLEHTGVVPYSFDVPLAQYFTPGKALHATLWHDGFGRPASHGCINLSPADARWLFAFTAKRAAPATTLRPGIRVRVRGVAAPLAAR